MAYQNVSKPRFWVNIIEWLIKTKVISPPQWQVEFLNTLPVNVHLLDQNDAIQIDFPIGAFNDKSFFTVLGHDYVSSNQGAKVRDEVNGGIEFGSYQEYVNGMAFLYPATPPEYNGFSIHIFDGTDASNVRYQQNEANEDMISPRVGSIVIGTYYDMPHSPELNLTMTREMDGVKRVRTKGGADLVNHRYTKPAMWGDLAAWELDTGHGIDQALSRSGRRVWDLSFNYLQDSDVFPALSNIGWEETYTYSYDALGNTLLDDDTFYSQVIHKTNGGQLPFIFQPDSSNANPDGFAICKFDMDSFQFEQVAKGIYNIKLKIREVW